MRAAAASRLLRRAAAAVAACLDLRLTPSALLPPRSLSPLLAELCRGQRKLQLQTPLAAGLQAASFVAAAGITHLDVHLGDDAMAPMDWLTAGCSGPALDWLAGCTSVTHLYIDALALTTSLPPRLLSLSLHADSVPLDLPLTLAACMSSLSTLQHLDLAYGTETPVRLPAEIQWPRSLQSIELCISFRAETDQLPVDATALGRSQGCTATLSITAEIGWVSSATVVTMLAELGYLDNFWLLSAYSGATVQQALARIHCGLFCWTGLLEDQEAVTQLPQASHIFLEYDSRRDTSGLDPGELHIFWTAVASRPVSIAITARYQESQVVVHDAGPAPAFEEPWAIWLQHLHIVQGLPLQSFQQLPSGWWVWRNAAAARLGMLAPEDVDDL